MKDFYEVLGLSREASEADIKRAFRELALKHHPDRNKDDPSAEGKFKEINEAYQVLSDPQRRQAYDMFGHAASGGSGAGFDPFGAAGGAGPNPSGPLHPGQGRHRRRSAPDKQEEGGRHAGPVR